MDNSEPLTKIRRFFRPRLSYVALLALGIQGGMLFLLIAQHHSGVLHPRGELFAILVAANFIVLLVSCVLFAGSLRKKKRRVDALCTLVLTVGSQLPLCGCFWYTAGTLWSDRVPHGLPAQIAITGAANLMDLHARYFYRHRVESARLIMLYNDLETPKSDLAAMEVHVAQLEQRIGRPLRAKIVWIRGPSLGQKHLSFMAFALGSETSSDLQSSGRLDRHELAHAVLTQFRSAGANPPTILHEGWAEANDGTDLSKQTWQVVEARLKDPRLNVKGLFSDSRYDSIDSIHYAIGGAFVDFLLRTFTVDQFVELYNRCQPETVDQDFRDVYGMNLEQLEAAFWQDAMRLTNTSLPE